MKRVAITTLGCKTNQFETAAMCEQFANAGHKIVPFSEQADIYLINSCTVTSRSDAETRRLIRRARRLNPDARIVATGCYAQVASQLLQDMPEVDTVLGNSEKKDIVSLVEAGENLVSDISTDQFAAPLEISSFAEHTRAFLQIQNGCDSFCTYCIVPYARGRSRSVPVENVLDGIRNLAAKGFQEVVLTGIHLGGYGLDLSPPTSLVELVRKIDGETLVPRLRLGSIEPNELGDDLIELMAQSPIICPHLHLPLQSGSNTVLKRMSRHYTADFFRDLLGKISSAIPNVFIGGDLIVGFPRETDQEFRETMRLVEESPFSYLHVFPYSRRPGTKAADLPGHLPQLLIKERSEHLRQLANKKKQSFLSNFVGKNLHVLVQGNDEKGHCRGLSRNYLNVRFAGSVEMLNREVIVTAVEMGNDADLEGIIAE
ncbi:MAG: tRNA (N(6)-L-threonylcarbamoyladenosine(37)-C(2))-methylthiotransferase MtaB [Deltaproteobacteria bacterium]